MTQLTDKIWTMDVPSMAFGFMVNNYATESELIYMLSMSDIADDDNAEETLITKPLPPGTWRFLFTTKTATEEDARRVVKTIHIEEAPSPYNDFAGGWRFGYVDYENRGEFSGYQGDAGSFGKSIDSLNSLLRSKGLDDKKNFALIEKL